METDRGPSGVGNLPDPGGRLHPDEALPSVVESAAKSAALVIPCCNFWTQETRLGRDQLIEQISEFHNSRGGKSECVVLDFRGRRISPVDDWLRTAAVEGRIAGFWLGARPLSVWLDTNVGRPPPWAERVSRAFCPRCAPCGGVWTAPVMLASPLTWWWPSAR